MINRKIIFFNGPPHCGKDTIAKAFHDARVFFSQCMSFADPLKDQACALLRVSRDELERIKDIAHPALKGGTPRQYLINLSEKMIKPCYGDDFFGYVALDKVQNLPHPIEAVYYTDSGFMPEAVPLLRAVGSENVVKVELHRVGTDFSKDSRSYWRHPEIANIVIQNDASVKVVCDRVYRSLPPNWFMR